MGYHRKCLLTLRVESRHTAFATSSFRRASAPVVCNQCCGRVRGILRRERSSQKLSSHTLSISTRNGAGNTQVYGRHLTHTIKNLRSSRPWVDKRCRTDGAHHYARVPKKTSARYGAVTGLLATTQLCSYMYMYPVASTAPQHGSEIWILPTTESCMSMRRRRVV